MSKTLDQERSIDALKRRSQNTAALAVQIAPEAPAPAAPPAVAVMPDPVTPDSIIAALPGPQIELPPLASAPQTPQAPLVRRRYALRAAFPILLLELAFIQTVRPPMLVPDVRHLSARLSAWLQRPAAAPPQIPQPTPRVIPVAAQTTAPALPPETPATASGYPAEGRGGRGDADAAGGDTAPSVEEHAPAPSLPVVSLPTLRPPLTDEALTPRSTALEDTRKVLRLMESALQDAAHAVLTAQADSESSP